MHVRFDLLLEARQCGRVPVCLVEKVCALLAFAGARKEKSEQSVRAVGKSAPWSNLNIAPKSRTLKPSGQLNSTVGNPTSTFKCSPKIANHQLVPQKQELSNSIASIRKRLFRVPLSIGPKLFPINFNPKTRGKLTHRNQVIQKVDELSTMRCIRNSEAADDARVIEML